MRKQIRRPNLHFILTNSIQFFSDTASTVSITRSLEYLKKNCPYNSKSKPTIIREIYTGCSGKATVSDLSLGSLRYCNMTIFYESIAH